MRFLLVFLLMMSTPAWAVTQWNTALPASGDNLTAWPAAVKSQWSILDTLLSNYRQSEKLIYKNSTTLTVTAGEVVVSNSGASTRLFLQDSGNTDITTTNLDSGSSFSAGTQYYVYSAASSATASSSTYYISLSSSAPTGPTYYKQLGSFTTDGSGNVISNKVYSLAYGAVNADSNGQPPVQAVYNYGSSGSAYTLKTGGLLVAFGTTGSISPSSSTSISNLPFTSASTYSVTTSTASTSPGMGCQANNSSGSSMTISAQNVSAGSNFNVTCNWVAIGY